MDEMKNIYKIHLFLRVFFGLAYLPFLFSALMVLFNILKGNISHPFQNSFMIENFYDICFFILITYVFSRYFFISYKIDDKNLLIKHPLSLLQTVSFSDINSVEVDGEFRKWPRFYRGINWISISLKNGKKIDIAWVKNHYQLANILKTYQMEKGA